MDAEKITEFRIEDTPNGKIKHYWLELTTDGLGQSIEIPLMVARGKNKGPTIGLTAAVHGNELNGISVIQRLFQDLDITKVAGVIIGVPVVNIPSYTAGNRFFTDGVDINRIMPGKENGNTSDVYAFRFVEKVLRKFDYLLDLHTASFGRVNSFYIRSDLENPITKKLAKLQNAQIIVNTPASDGTLRGAAEELSIPAITIEVGNPHLFQRKLIKSGLVGVHNVLAHLKIIPDKIDKNEQKTVVCNKSVWIYTDVGGLLTVSVELTEKVKEGQHIATIKDIFGKIIKKYYAPEDGIVIGKSVNPVNLSGGRILHLGIIE